MKTNLLFQIGIVICISAVLLFIGCTPDPQMPTNDNDPPPSPPPTVAENTTTPPEKPSSPPPLVVDTSAPLLLDEVPSDPESSSAAADPDAADNAPCFVCHVNYQEEPLALRHAKVGFGCITCHGKSYAHRNDEDNITPPDHMYPRDKINPSCRHCHEAHNAPPEKIIARWFQCCADRSDTQTVVCTDCHGQHRLTLRTTRWNKATGKLLPKN